MAGRVVGCLLAFLVPTLAHAEAEKPQDLAPGVRVRVTAPTVAPGPLVGTVRSLSADAIEIAVKGREGTIQMPRASVLRLEVSRGRNRGKGALIGAATLATAGIVVGAVGCRDSGDFDSGFCAAVLGGTGLVLGGGVGALVGSGERWTELPSDRFRVSLAPTPGGGVELSVRFTF